MDTARQLEAQGKTVRVVSMPSWELFDAQNKAYRESVPGRQSARARGDRGRLRTGLA